MRKSTGRMKSLLRYVRLLKI